MIQLRKLLEKYKLNTIRKQEELLAKGYDKYFRNIEYYLNTIPKEIIFNLKEKDLILNDSDDNKTRKFKKRNLRKLKNKDKPPTLLIEYQRLVKSYFPGNLALLMHSIAENIGMISLQLIIESQKIIQSIDDSFAILEKKNGLKNLNSEDINIELDKLSKKITQINLSNKDNFHSVFIMMMGAGF